MKEIKLIKKATVVTVEITAYNETMQLESMIEEVRFEGHLPIDKATAKAKRQCATRDQIAIVKDVKHVTRTLSMTEETFALFATVEETAND